jgi:hypothetical protein
MLTTRDLVSKAPEWCSATMPEARGAAGESRDHMTICDLSDQDREIVLRALWGLRLENGPEISEAFALETEEFEAGVAHLEMIDAVAAKLGGQVGVPIYGAFR